MVVTRAAAFVLRENRFDVVSGVPDRHRRQGFDAAMSVTLFTDDEQFLDTPPHGFANVSDRAVDHSTFQCE